MLAPEPLQKITTTKIKKGTGKEDPFGLKVPFGGSSMGVSRFT
jgi:hypothetical protein